MTTPLEIRPYPRPYRRVGNRLYYKLKWSDVVALRRDCPQLVEQLDGHWVMWVEAPSRPLPPANNAREAFLRGR